MPRLPKHPSLNSKPFVSVLVPMRNEERNVRVLVQSLKAVSYPSVEFIILNDQSTDRTQERLQDEIGQDSRFTVLQGRELPEEWVGKVHACHQLQESARGDYLLFIDADIQFKPQAIEQSLALMERRHVKLLTGFPAFEVPPFLSKLLVPMMHFVVFFHLPIMLANHSRFGAATAACGMWMMFERESYNRMGGHASVRNSLVEDVHSARNMKASGSKVLLANITSSVKCKMYETNPEVWEGFLKNSYTGIGRSPVLAIGLIAFYTAFYIFPFFLALFGVAAGSLLLLIPYVLIVAQRSFVDLMTGQKWYLSPLIPLQAGALIAVLLESMRKHLKKQPYTWKGRNYS